MAFAHSHAPELGASSGERFVTGLAAVGEKLVILLGIDQLVLSTFETPDWAPAARAEGVPAGAKD